MEVVGDMLNISDLRECDIISDVQVLIFNSCAHGFKLSPTYPDRIYYYPNLEYRMDMKIINPGKWVIHRVVKEDPIKIVTLKRTV